MQSKEIHFRLTETEHQAIAGALRYCLSILEPSENGRRGTGAPNDPFTAAPPPSRATVAQAPEAGPAKLETPSAQPPRDRWMHDRQGNEIAQPNAEAYSVRIWKCEQQPGKNGPFLDVRWDQRRAYCHDPKLFPWILQAAKTKAQIVLYLRQRDKNSVYDHIIGIKA